MTVGAFVILFAVYAFMSAATDAARAFAGDRVGPYWAGCCSPYSRWRPA
ncbi:hypothetical protein [Streptomyces sp. NBC_00271]|nr:hypothetical protein [Streptomyces sp. NBC_00271]